jgi:hypothetical protein
MIEDELRSLVRSVIARHSDEMRQPLEAAVATHKHHASHFMFRLEADPGAEGHCLIESAVMCNHCGYCKSLGH